MKMLRPSRPDFCAFLHFPAFDVNDLVTSQIAREARGTYYLKEAMLPTVFRRPHPRRGSCAALHTSPLRWRTGDSWWCLEHAIVNTSHDLCISMDNTLAQRHPGDDSESSPQCHGRTRFERRCARAVVRTAVALQTRRRPQRLG